MGFAARYLGEARRREIAGGLFSVTTVQEAKGEMRGLCPIHGEKNPSFAYNFKKDLYNCLACGADGDLLRLWCEVKGYAGREGLAAFCDEYGIRHGKGNTAKAPREHSAPETGDGDPETVLHAMAEAWRKFPPLPELWIERLERTRGWSRDTIERLGLRMQTHRFTKQGTLVPVARADRIAIPIRDGNGRLINIRLYKPGTEQFKIVSWARTTGANALFPYPMPRPEVTRDPAADRFLLLCEGESDTICALSHGFDAVTQTGKVKRWPDDQLAPFRGRDVVVAYDADEAGVRYAGWACEALLPVAKSVRSLQWPDCMGVRPDGSLPKDHGEDLTDFFVKHRKKPEQLVALIEKSAPLPPPSPPMTGRDGSPAAFPSTVHRYFEQGVNRRFSFRPRLLAEHIVADFRLMSNPETGILYRWNGIYWEVFDEDHLKAEAIRRMGNESQKGRIEDAIYQVRMLSTIPADRKVNDRLDWICLQNGMLNFLTFEIADHNPDFYCTHALPVAFDPDSERRCDRWERYLETNVQTAEPIAQLQEFAGYCLVRHARFEKCLFLLGPGRDGKSTFMKVMREIVGDENCAAVAFPDLMNEFHRSTLYNKLLNISTEIGAQEIESPYFKAITSGDPINGAFKHRDAFTFQPYCKLIFAGNMLPRVRDNTDAYFQRILPVRFKRQFLEGDPERDPELIDKFKAELSEIFYWALCGLKRLTENRRFTDCAETRELLMGYRRSNNPVLCYVEDQCQLGEDRSVDKAELYGDYRAYCGANGYMPFNRENFFRELYSAIDNLRQHRPRGEQGRNYRIDGIGIVKPPKE